METGGPVLSRLSLRSADAGASDRFVQTFLPAVAEPPDGTRFPSLRFRQAEPTPSGAGRANADTRSPYWKSSVFTDDLDRLRASMVSGGVEVSPPVQFGDIGYLCHLKEPGGNEIELLQRTFRDHPPVEESSPDTLGLVTLRVDDPVASDRFYRQALGMRLLCTMAVDDGRPDPFDLLFYGAVGEEQPDPDPAAVVNREWLYQRPVGLIELQHHRRPGSPIDRSPPPGPGLDHIQLVAADNRTAMGRLQAGGVAVEQPEAGPVGFASPEGHRFLLSDAGPPPVSR